MDTVNIKIAEERPPEKQLCSWKKKVLTNVVRWSKLSFEKVK
jgi:hypothetical protein